MELKHTPIEFPSWRRQLSPRMSEWLGHGDHPQIEGLVVTERRDKSLEVSFHLH